MLFGREKLEIPDEFWERLLGTKKENRYLSNIQDVLILNEINTLIEHSKPEDAYYRIMRIRGMLSMTHEKLCDLAENKDKSGEVKMK